MITNRSLRTKEAIQIMKYVNEKWLLTYKTMAKLLNEHGYDTNESELLSLVRTKKQPNKQLDLLISREIISWQNPYLLYDKLLPYPKTFAIKKTMIRLLIHINSTYEIGRYDTYKP